MWKMGKTNEVFHIFTKKTGCFGPIQWKTRWKMWITLGNHRMISSFLCKAMHFPFFTMGKTALFVFRIFSLETDEKRRFFFFV